MPNHYISCVQLFFSFLLIIIGYCTCFHKFCYQSLKQSFLELKRIHTFKHIFDIQTSLIYSCLYKSSLPNIVILNYKSKDFESTKTVKKISKHTFHIRNLQNSEVYFETYIVDFETYLTESLISKHIAYISKHSIFPSNTVLNHQKFIQIPIHPPLGIYLPSLGTNNWH